MIICMDFLNNNNRANRLWEPYRLLASVNNCASYEGLDRSQNHFWGEGMRGGNFKITFEVLVNNIEIFQYIPISGSNLGTQGCMREL